MKKLAAVLVAILGLSLLTQGQTAGYVYQSPRTIFTTVTSGGGIRVIGSTAAFHQLVWNVQGTVATCQIQVDSSVDGTTWTSAGVLASTLCTSNGTALSTSTVVNFVRINVTAISGAGATVTAVLSGFANNPSGGGGGTTINPTNNILPKRSNATTFADSSLTDDGTKVTGTEPIQTIAGTVSTTPVNGIQIGGATPGLASNAATALNIQVGNGSSTGTLDMRAGATQFWSLGATGSGNTVTLASGFNGNVILTVAGSNKTATSATAPAVVIGSEGGNNGTITSTSGTAAGVNFGNGSAGNAGGLRFSPTSGTANFNAVSLFPQINQTGGANGTINVLFISPTNTALVGAENLIDAGVNGTGGLFTVQSSGNVKPTLYGSQTNCASSAGTCSAAPAGRVSIAAAATTVTVATTAVTANSEIFVQEDATLGTALSVTCNTTTGRIYTITTRTAGTSFVITASAAPTTNPACLSYHIIN